MMHRLTRPLRYGFTALALACVTAVAQAPTDIRVALVIGNAAYAGNAALANPTNDAKAMAETLRGLGFTVVEIRDGGRTQMNDAIVKVRDTLKGKQGVGMLYYAGHGLQLDWRNYMVPVDAKLSSAADVARQTVDVNAVIEAFKGAGNRMNILVLDACRDNPFRGGTSAGKGLAQVDAPPGTFLAYATAPGNVAEDGDEKSGNGLYTQYLLQELKKPTAKIEDVFKRVRLNVRKQSEGRQIPWESTSLEDDFFFNDGKLVAVAKPSERVKETEFNLEKVDWDKIKDSKKPDDFYAFLNKFPNGQISEAAQAKLDALSKTTVVASLAKDQVPVTAKANERFQLNDKYYIARRDGYSQAETGRRVEAVTSQNGDVVDMNNGKSQFTVHGATLRASIGNTQLNFDPPLNTLPAGDFQVGKKWQTRTTIALPFGFKGWIEQDLKVLEREQLKNEAGTFDTFKVEMKGFTFQGTYIDVMYWVEPAYGWPVKLQYKQRNRSGQVERFYIDEWHKKPDRG